MPIYKIEQYEVHTQTYKVEADDEAQAIKRLFDGEGDAWDNALDFIEVADDLGLPADEYPALRDALRSAHVTVTDVIPSIRSIEEE